ncbi:DinB family protein [Ferrovibrio sp.]|uniref:DinB family protein n=1 Tax=Ferrovibrio sp. TaxID=1917215 RepID=UPI0026016CB9|nr:DinB family protein [Ferrovibrio sp.]
MPDSLMLQHVRRMARYNAWANARLYNACATLPPAAYHAARPSFFGSIHATLNHILVGDSAWFGRFTARPATQITALNQILHDDFASLRAAREAKDAEIIAFCDGLDEATLQGTFSYTNFRGQSFTDPLCPPLLHAFNHQTHHRGQVHGLLSHAGVAPPELDLIYFLREPA